jgi:chemotaxis protein methyltransferase CheR
MAEKTTSTSIGEDIDIHVFANALKKAAGYDFFQYSEKSLKRRISRIMADTHYSMDKLVSEIIADRNFADRIVKEITVNTTELFRDPSIWFELRTRVLPSLLNRKSINIWHAGCSTGQEVYSLLLLLNELELLGKTKVFGSDINSDVLKTAQNGKYRWRFNSHYLTNFYSAFPDISEKEKADALFSKYFTIDNNKDELRVNEIITNKAEFVKHDLVTEDCFFFSHQFDLILCRNVVIYFNANLQDQVFKSFHEKLAYDGFLLLGIHESILGVGSSLFEKKDIGYIKK